MTRRLLRTAGALALWLWGGLWYGLGILAGVLWTIILVGAVAALAGFQAGRYK